MNGLLNYQCVVHESGYEIVTCEHRNDIFDATSEVKGMTKLLISPIDPNSTKRIFNLMEYPGAYKEFVDSAEEDDKAFYPINFVNKYGLLTNAYSPPNTQDDMTTVTVHMLMMSIAVKALVHIKAGMVENLNQGFVNVDGNFKVNVAAKPILKADLQDVRTNGQTPPRNSSEAAYHYICNVVNENLNDSLITEISVNPTNTGTDMTVHPKDLISALWLQLAHAVSRNLEFKQCAECSTFFEVKSPKRRFERKYCTDKCGKRVYARKRREKEKAK